MELRELGVCMPFDPRIPMRDCGDPVKLQENRTQSEFHDSTFAREPGFATYATIACSKKVLRAMRDEPRTMTTMMTTEEGDDEVVVHESSRVLIHCKMISINFSDATEHNNHLGDPLHHTQSCFMFIEHLFMVHSSCGRYAHAQIHSALVRAAPKINCIRNSPWRTRPGQPSQAVPRRT